ncbi:MAG: ribonuclease H-like domain-containing protein [Lachnospiraceae bacterium]|nr:ribonuclease H-like domain-containing protein [Lachnospiraceae bacterium]
MKTIDKSISKLIWDNFIENKEGSTAYNLGRSAFFDIETTGLSPKGSSIYLIGVVYKVSEDKASEENFSEENPNCPYRIRQWFADTYDSEKEILESFFSFLSEYDTLYSYNGKNFDVRFIEGRCENHDITIPEKIKELFHDNHIDIYREICCLKNFLCLTGARQKDFEVYLGLNREDMYSGKDLITKYSEYMTKKKFIISDKSIKKETDALEEILLLHNFCDIEGMLILLPLIQIKNVIKTEDYDYFKRHIFDISCEEKSEEKSENYFKENPEDNPRLLEIKCKLGEDSFFINYSLKLTLENKELKYYISDYKNYYYLPSEDTIIHKSLAAFIDNSEKEKATKDNCFLKKNGAFIVLNDYNKKTKAKKALMENYRLFLDCKDNKTPETTYLELETAKDKELVCRLIYLYI